VNLIPFSKQYLRLHEALPFGLRDAGGRLLLAAGQRVDSGERLEQLLREPLFADETESSDWRRRLAAAVDAMIRRNASLKDIAQAMPAAAQAATPDHELAPGAQCNELAMALDAALRDPPADAAWPARLLALQVRTRALRQRRLDAALYHLIYAAGQDAAHYSSHHALLCALIAGEAARLAGWPDATQCSLECAALTMNIAMRRLQDQLAVAEAEPTPEARRQIDAHPHEGARQLAEAGVADALWLDIVRMHHDDSRRALALAALDTAGQAARLLRRVDIFTAKLSRRATRQPMSPVQAAREACLGADGRPDEIGAVLIKAMGMYPPGSFVELASGERGIVFARGSQANRPLVAALVGASGAAFGEPLLRDTAEPRHAVRGALAAASVRVMPSHERVLALRP
jgi:HD-GYP domain-containing protein (c-di-GMP phosphodiesterase class II)